MTAKIAGFVSRAEAGLRPPRSFSRKISPADGGVALHYGGPATHIDGHDECLRTWRGWQAFHMDTHGWVDLAYTLGVCDHGYVLAGRGVGVRTAAQGTNAGNDDYYAVVWLGGEGETPTQKALDAIAWAVLELRMHGGAGMRVKPHRSFHTTACPGPTLAEYTLTLDGHAIPAQEPAKPSAPVSTTPTIAVKGPPPVIIVLHPDGKQQFLCDRAGATHITLEERAVLIAGGVPYVDGTKASTKQRGDFLKARGVAA